MMEPYSGKTQPWWMTKEKYLEWSKNAGVPNHCPLCDECPKAKADRERAESPESELLLIPYLWDWCPEVIITDKTEPWISDVEHYLDCPLFSKWWWETAIQKGRVRLPARTGLSNRVRYRVFKRDNFTCQYCGRKPPEVILEIDHRVPVSKCGTDDFDNLITACKDCNRGKSDDLPTEAGPGKVSPSNP